MKKGLGSIILFFVVVVLVMGIAILVDRLRTTEESLSEILGGIGASCTKECNHSGLRQCYDDSDYMACGNYDSDSCLEWGSPMPCPSGYICSNGACIAYSTSTIG